jgi:hypothetical protein
MFNIRQGKKFNKMELLCKTLINHSLQCMCISQQRNQLNTLTLSQSLYCVLILYVFRASRVLFQEALH